MRLNKEFPVERCTFYNTQRCKTSRFKIHISKFVKTEYYLFQYINNRAIAIYSVNLSLCKKIG
jgi:hypothetical protein